MGSSRSKNGPKGQVRWTNAYDLEQIGSHIQSLRKEKGYTQADFAEDIGISHATLSALENGRSVSSRALMRALSFLGQKVTIAPKSALVVVSQEDNRMGDIHERTA